MGKMFLQALHIKYLILLGHFKSQIAFQRARILVLFEHPRLLSIFLASLSNLDATLYVLLIVKIPFGVLAHT